MTRWNAATKTLICAALVALVGLPGNADEHGGLDCENAEFNLTEKVCANEDAIESNDMDIAANTANIESNDTDIAANAAAITANKESADMGIMANAAAITANKESADMRLDMHEMLVGANAAGIAENAATLRNHASMIDANTRSIDMVDERVSQVAAMAAALSAVPNAPSTGEQFFIGVGMGNHDGESSLAIGLSGRVGPNQNILVNAGVANSGGETTVRAGVGWAF